MYKSSLLSLISCSFFFSTSTGAEPGSGVETVLGDTSFLTSERLSFFLTERRVYFEISFNVSKTPFPVMAIDST